MTTIFAPTSGPRVFALPPGADFSRALLAGLDARLAGAPPEAAAQVEIWVNTERARRTLTARLAEGPARLMPRLRVVTELSTDPFALTDLGPPVAALRRKLDLSHLIAALIAAEPGIAAETAAFDLADSLGDLLDEMQGEGIDPADFDRIDPEEHAAHWQRSLRFLRILRDFALVAGLTDGEARARAVAEAVCAAWAEAPPQHPVIVAGSTGSRSPTRLFMAAVATLPQGAVVLPGLDEHLPEVVWERLREEGPGLTDHPQFGFAHLGAALGFDPARVPRWHEAETPASARNALVSLAMRPAPVTDQWRQEGAELAGTLSEATAELTWIEAPDAQAEALAIAVTLRDAAEAGQPAALITPDRVLARRVTAALDRWRLIPDDSAGRPLALTPPGVLLRHLADLMCRPIAPEALLVALKHPLTNSAPGARRRHLELTAALETRILRGGTPQVDWAAVEAWAEDIGEDAPGWAAWLRGCLGALAEARDAPLPQVTALHLRAAETLAAGPQGSPAHGLWEKEAGAQARAVLMTLAAEADAYGGVIRPSEYRALLQSLMAARDVPEEAVVTHPGIAIWGALEARVQSAGLVILGGLNEGLWPRLPPHDPWLNRAMRRELGLPSPERRVGLSAHDFQQAMGAPRVILTRALRDAEAPTVAARWLMRMENLMKGLGAEGKAALAAAKARGGATLRRAAAVGRPSASLPAARRPSPRPPVAARPASLSVTQIETLVRDPYAIYARKVLGLRALDLPGRSADALARGRALHHALEGFVAVTQDGLPANPREILEDCVARALAETAPWPAVRAIWAARIARAADWLIAGERERRARATPAAREVMGQRPLDGTPAPFAVSAKADRIDRTGDGRYAIYDYKSGDVPSEKEARAFHLQLPLEAAIAVAGGYSGLPAAEAAHLELIGLGAARTRPLDASAEAIAETWDRLRELIAFYQDPAQGFTARLRPQRLTYASDYDHLSRRGEWSDGDAP